MYNTIIAVLLLFFLQLANSLHLHGKNVTILEKRDESYPSHAYHKLDWSNMVSSSSSSSYHSYKKGSSPIRGVNLGGWLVLEAWINTDLFSSKNFGGKTVPLDEFSFVETLGWDKAKSLLEDHYSSWITESDFKSMKSYGLNAVRIPVGYWAFKLMTTDKYYQGSQVKYLEKAIKWARTYDLKVWIDLHGAPGSQNGYDSSGHINRHDWSGYDNMDQTKEVLKYIFAKYGGDSYSDVVIGIELVNEPLTSGSGGLSQSELSNFYADTINEIRNTVKSQQNIILHDGYLNQGAWSGEPYNSEKVIYDTHLYMLYNSYYKTLIYADKISQVCSWGSQLAALSYPEVVGEMTAAWNPDSNSVYTKSISSWSATDIQLMSRFVQAEFNAFEKNYGWFFWNWKMGGSDQWDFQVLIKNKVIPNPVSQRTYTDCV